MVGRSVVAARTPSGPTKSRQGHQARVAASTPVSSGSRHATPASVTRCKLGDIPGTARPRHAPGDGAQATSHGASRDSASANVCPPESDGSAATGDRRALAVESGAAVSFLADLTLERAEEWWRNNLGASPSTTIVLVAREAGRIAGSVQLHPAWAPNQPHRAEITKLLVHRRNRGAGLGTRLMHAVEAAAREAGFTLLTLDTRRGDSAERLYRSLGWTASGIIPLYALDPGGGLHDTVVFYKALDQAREPPSHSPAAQ